MELYRVGFTRHIIVISEFLLQSLTFSSVGWACRGVGVRIRDGSHRWHIRVLERPESGDFAVQSSPLVEKVGFLGGCPDVCIFYFKFDFTSDR